MFNARQAAELTKPLTSLQSILDELEVYCKRNKDSDIDYILVQDKRWVEEFHHRSEGHKAKQFTSFFTSLGFKVEYVLYEEKSCGYQVIKISW